jgi:uncharacterized ubiquitin-like protein YukD
MYKITVKNFTGRAFALNVDPNTTVSDLKDAIAEAKSPGSQAVWQIETHLTYKGHELRDHQPLSHYGISQGNTLHISEHLMLV